MYTAAELLGSPSSLIRLGQPSAFGESEGGQGVCTSLEKELLNLYEVQNPGDPQCCPGRSLSCGRDFRCS